MTSETPFSLFTPCQHFIANLIPTSVELFFGSHANPIGAPKCVQVPISDFLIFQYLMKGPPSKTMGILFNLRQNISCWRADET
jgi:hypothetical protein